MPPCSTSSRVSGWSVPSLLCGSVVAAQGGGRRGSSSTRRRSSTTPTSPLRTGGGWRAATGLPEPAAEGLRSDCCALRPCRAMAAVLELSFQILCWPETRSGTSSATGSRTTKRYSELRWATHAQQTAVASRRHKTQEVFGRQTRRPEAVRRRTCCPRPPAGPARRGCGTHPGRCSPQPPRSRAARSKESARGTCGRGRRRAAPRTPGAWPRPR